MKKLFSKPKPKPVAKPTRLKTPTLQPRSLAMNDTEKDQQHDDQSSSQSQDRSDEQGNLNPSQGGGSVQAMQQGGPYHTGASGNDRGTGNGGSSGDGGGDEDQKTYVLGYGEAATKLKFESYPREEVWKTLVEEARAQEVYETEDYDRRIQVRDEDEEKMEQAMQGKYDPDALRDAAKKLNEQRTNPDEVKKQSEAIQKLRGQLYKRGGKEDEGGGGGGASSGQEQYPGSMTGGAGQSAPAR